MEEITIKKSVLFAILNSHARLAHAEYNRNLSYNNTHFSYIAEEKALSELARIGIVDEFLKSVSKEIA